MVVSALALFTATTIWAAFKTVPRKVYHYKMNEPGTAQAPDRVDAGSYFYASEKTSYISVSIPVSVELDDSFNGVELRGDTSMFRYIQVKTNTGTGRQKNIEIWCRTLQTGDTGAGALDNKLVLDMLSKSNVSVRVGIGSGRMPGPGYRRLSFGQCRKVSTRKPVSDTEFNISVFDTDTLWLQLNAEKLTLDFPKLSDKPTAWAHLEGKSARVVINNYSSGTLDAVGLQTREIYVSNSKDARLRVYASDLARIRHAENCEIQVEGTPAHQWIERIE